MVQTLATNSNNDIFLDTSGNLVMLNGVEAVAAACTTACKSQLGEMVLQTGLGLPNFQTIWIGTPDYAFWQTYLQTTIQNVLGVTQVDNLTLAAKNNILSYQAQIQTIYGPTTIEGTVNG